MKPRNIKVGNQTTINVSLEEATSSLEEVVVVAYGAQKKVTMTGSVASVNIGSLKTPVANLSNALQGKVAGIISVQSSGEPGYDNSTFTIRGIGTFTGNTSPLVIVDGVQRDDVNSTYGGAYNNIDPEDIVSISLLKDASATAIYGSRAANGVVLVTTKRGKAGMKPQLEFSARYGIQTLNANDFRVLTADEYIRVSKAACAMSLFTRGSLDYFTKKYVDETYFNSHINHSQFDLNSLTDEFYLKDAYGNGDTDWWDLMTRNAATQDYSIGIRGGSKESSYSASIYYKDQKGIVKGGNSKMLGVSLILMLQFGILFGLNWI